MKKLLLLLMIIMLAQFGFAQQKQKRKQLIKAFEEMKQRSKSNKEERSNNLGHHEIPNAVIGGEFGQMNNQLFDVKVGIAQEIPNLKYLKSTNKWHSTQNLLNELEGELAEQKEKVDFKLKLSNYIILNQLVNKQKKYLSQFASTDFSEQKKYVEWILAKKQNQDQLKEYLGNQAIEVDTTEEIELLALPLNNNFEKNPLDSIANKLSELDFESQKASLGLDYQLGVFYQSFRSTDPSVPGYGGVVGLGTVGVPLFNRKAKIDHLKSYKLAQEKTKNDIDQQNKLEKANQQLLREKHYQFLLIYKNIQQQLSDKTLAEKELLKIQMNQLELLMELNQIAISLGAEF